MKNGFVEVAGKRIFYREEGRGLPLIYVHGDMGSSIWWAKVMVIRGARAIALDLPNFGRSDRIAEIEVDRYADYLAGVIAALGLERPILVAHSFGGAVAISLAARRPELIRALLLSGSVPPSGIVLPESRYAVRELFLKNRDVMRKGIASVVSSPEDPGFIERLVDEAALMSPPCFVGHSRALAAFNYGGSAAFNFDYGGGVAAERRGPTAAYNGPVLVLWGSADRAITEAMARETASAFRRGRLEILEDAGHTIQVEHPSIFTRIMESFVAENDGT